MTEERTGRVVRLHFRCQAEIPIGSSLRVTGSSLWAPGSAATDPSDSEVAVNRTESSAFPVTEEDAMYLTPTQSLYTSSVEMVTTPEEYPIWKTRKPVVVVIHSSKKSVQHHYYRYLVVSPGGSDGGEPEQEEDEDEVAVVSTSNEFTGSTAVVQWEDPFGTLGSHKRAAVSTLSLTSSVTRTGHGSGDYRNLPYRTVDIDVKSARPDVDDETEMAPLDHWNMGDDASFRAYSIREAVRMLCMIVA